MRNEPRLEFTAFTSDTEHSSISELCLHLPNGPEGNHRLGTDSEGAVAYGVTAPGTDACRDVPAPRDSGSDTVMPLAPLGSCHGGRTPRQRDVESQRTGRSRDASGISASPLQQEQ